VVLGIEDLGDWGSGWHLSGTFWCGCEKGEEGLLRSSVLPECVGRGEYGGTPCILFVRSIKSLDKISEGKVR
jgi:hypothetical protein